MINTNMQEESLTSLLTDMNTQQLFSSAIKRWKIKRDKVLFVYLFIQRTHTI